MDLEIVSHCWNYSRLLTYQLSSLVLYPPSTLSITMTVFHNRDDERTTRVLKYFENIQSPNVKWLWWHLEQPQLFRRAIGRNLAAESSTADWVWFCDCDQVFHRGFLDNLAAQLSKCSEPLVFPALVGCTDHLLANDPVFQRLNEEPAVVDIDPARFRLVPHHRAIGGMQIARGELVRRIGYCKGVRRFMRPARQFGRTREDVKFRRLIGSPGKPVDVAGLYRIEHQAKGRRWLFQRARSL